MTQVKQNKKVFREVNVRLSNGRVFDAEDTQITAPQDLIDFMEKEIGDMASEVFAVVYLNNSNEPLSFSWVAKGGWKAALVDPKSVFQAALLQEAPKIMLFHNHPSGNVNPSGNDTRTTQKLVNGAHILDIEILDHIIVSEDDYFSFAAHDMMDPDDDDSVNIIKSNSSDMPF